MSDDETGSNKAVNDALSSPMLGDVDLHEAKGAMIRVMGGPDMTVTEAEKAAELVSAGGQPAGPDHLGMRGGPGNARARCSVMVVITGVKRTPFRRRTACPPTPSKGR